MSHSPARPRAIGAALAAGVLTLGVTTAPAPAVADTEIEAELLRLVNAEREEAGLPAVTLDPDLTAGAEAWSAQLASSGGLAHDTFEVAGATAWAENVGRASVEDAAARLHEMLMASPQHGANILDPSWTVAGIGVTVVDGTVWMTQRFADASVTATDVPAVETVLPSPDRQPAAAPIPEPTIEPAPAAVPAPQPVVPQEERVDAMPADPPTDAMPADPPADAAPADPPPAVQAASQATAPPPTGAPEPAQANRPAPSPVNPGRSGSTSAAAHRQGPAAEPGSQARGNAHGHDRNGGNGRNGRNGGNGGNGGNGRP